MSQLNRVTSLEEKILNNLREADATGQLMIALSGGLDSKTLLHVLVRLRNLNYVDKLQAIHINHGLQEMADQWQAKCQDDCKSYQVECFTTKLNLGNSCTSNIEALARDGRYQFFASSLKAEQWLLMAHHQEDQAETLLFRLLRGCGIQGASAIPRQRVLGQGKLLRPLLNISRAEIESYAIQQRLDWIDDPSNVDEKFSRNFLRHQIMPKLKQKWPGYAKTFSRFSQLAAEQALLLDEVAAEDLVKVQTKALTINTGLLRSLSLVRQKNCLHYWGKKQAKFAPSSNEIEQLLKQLDASHKKSIAVDFAGQLVRSFSGHLFLLSTQSPLPLEKKIQWKNMTTELLLSNELRLTGLKSHGSGLRLPHANETVWVDKRRGGEKCLPEYRQKATELKKIYQELNVPPWQRQWLPIIYFEHKIAAVPGVFMVKEFMAEENQPSLQLLLQQAE